MCGRFTLAKTLQEIADTFQAQAGSQSINQRYNIAPTQDVLSLVQHEQERQLTTFRWGLIPSWAKDSSIAHKMINARAETITEKPSFRTLIKRRRCAIIADGFYEWKQEGKQKVPQYITVTDQQIIAFAGLWDSWHSPEGGTLETCTIITTAANSFVQQVHNRMPVILTPEQAQDWLAIDEQDTPALLAFLQPYNPEAMQMRQVSRLVNNPKLDTPELLADQGNMQQAYPNLFGF